jgi:HMG box factor
VGNLLTPVHHLAFILYRQHYQAAVVAQNPGLANPEISKIIGEQWRKLPQATKDEWKNLAEVIANQAAVVLHRCSSC